MRQAAAARSAPRPPGCRLVLLCGLWLACAVRAAAAVPGFQLELLLSDGEPLYRELAGAFQAELSIACATRCTVAPSVRVSQVEGWQAAAPRDLLITVGKKAALEAARLGATRVVYGLIPETIWHKLQQLRPQAPGDASAVFLEQPLARQFRLLKLTMPEDRRRVGVVLGPDSLDMQASLTKAAADYGLELRVKRVREWDEVGPAVETLAGDIDVLLAVPDPLVFNRDNLYGILLTSYAAGVPVMGYSETLVKSGAMLGLYTTVADMARQLAHISSEFITDRHTLPPAMRSAYFEIGVNRSVARSLGIEVPDTSVLRLQLNLPR